MEKEILDFIAADCRLDHLVQTMPQEYMDYIVDLFDLPFELEGEKDKEMLIFLYVVDRIRYLYYYLVIQRTYFYTQAPTKMSEKTETLWKYAGEQL